MRRMDLRALALLMVCILGICAMETDFTKGRDSSKDLLNSYNPLCPRGHLPIAKLLPHEEDCSLFYICQNGQAILQKCPPKLYFNPSKSVCDFPGNAKCKKDDTPHPRGRINDQQLVVSCPMTPDHLLLPHPTDCGKFFSCHAGIAHLTACQKGLHFNEALQICDYPENAGCDTGFTETPRGKIGEGISNDLCPSERTQFPVLRPHSSDCGKFYICDGDTPHLKVCQPGLHFNPKTQTCDYPRNAGCESSTITEKPKDKSIGDDLYPQCPTVHGGNPILLPHKTDCGKFYICDTGVPYLKVCQDGLHFNPKVKTCDYPANAGCGPDLSKKEPSGRLGEIGVCSTSQNGMAPHPSECTKFFICDKGEAYAQKCPSGLHFNAALQACDYPENAHCEKGSALHSEGVPSPFCPTIEGKTPVFYRHPTNCSVYYMCSNGMAYRFECPARLHFNLRLRICDYEWVARCPTGKSSDNASHGT